VGILFIPLISLDIHTDKKFYYAFSDKVYLTPQNNKILVKFTESFDKSDAEKSLRASESGIKLIWRSYHVAEVTAGTSKYIENLLKSLKLREDVSSCMPFYKTEDGLGMGVTDEILVKFLPDVSKKQQQELQNKFETKVAKTTKIY